MELVTERLKIYTTFREEMEHIIENETDEDMKTAYGEMLQGALDHPEQWEWYSVWNIELKDGTIVGDLCFKGLNQDGSVEIGYGILEAHRGRGYAAEAAGAAVSWALSQPGVTRVEAETEPGNIASRRVLEKCGFVPTGTFGAEGPRFTVSRA